MVIVAQLCNVLNVTLHLKWSKLQSLCYMFLSQFFQVVFLRKKSNMLPEKQEGEKVSLRTLDLRCKE